MRLKGRIDNNQNEIVQMFRKIGASVQILSSVGNGCPDLLVGIKGRNILIELKDGNKPPSQQRLTRDEDEFIKTWNGDKVRIIKSSEEAFELINNIWK